MSKKFAFIEGAIRALAVLAGVGAGVAGGFTLHHLLIVFRTVIPIIGEPLPLETPIRAYDSNVIPYTQVSVGLAIGLAILGLFVSISIFLRCCDGSNSDGKKKVARRIIHGMDVVIILLCVIGLGVGGVIGALGANTWTNLVAQINTVAPVLSNYMSLLDELRRMLIATAATSLFACLVYAVLFIWLIIFMARSCSTMKYNV